MCVCVCVCVCGTRGGTQGHSTSEPHLQPIFILYLKQGLKPGVVAHACNPSIWEAETGGSRFEDSLSYLVRPPQLGETLFQIKNKNGLEV